jgi:hypothetical protein
VYLHKKRDYMCFPMVYIYSMSFVDGFPPHWPRFIPSSGHVGFVVGKAALGQVFSEYL